MLSSRRTATAVAAALAASAVVSADFLSMSVDDVQQLLEQNELAPFFGEEFEAYRVDGQMLKVLQQESFSAEDFPNAKSFHWSKLWSVLDATAGEKPRPIAAASPERARRRALAGNDAPGIHIARDAAILSFGVDGDASIQRTDDSELSVNARLLVDGDAGTYDVGASLDAVLGMADLLQQVADGTAFLVNSTEPCVDNTPAPVSVFDDSYDCSDALFQSGPSGVYNTIDDGTVVCNNDLSSGGWTLAMNIDTSDGNVVDYQNSEFWESAFSLGGATDDAEKALTQDYKNLNVFGNSPVGQIMVVVHEEGSVKGFRAWDMLETTHPLSYYFSGGDDEINRCGYSSDELLDLELDAYVSMTSRVFDADDGELIAQEPMVHDDDCLLFANMDVANTNDFNRLTCAAHPDLEETGNYGWGLGTLYDANIDGDGQSLDNSPCPTSTTRPLCDAQMHSTAGNWGSSDTSITGNGMIGTDNVCNGGCPWTIESGYEYDYAIYIRPYDQPIYDSCEAANDADGASGAYLLTSGEIVYCNNDISLGGWTLALNIDTSDGNVVDYSNFDFWESPTATGGAQSYAISPLYSDFKSTYAFSDLDAYELLVVVHEEGETVGYRAWTLYNAGAPLASYFSDGSNDCGESGGNSLTHGDFNYVTSSIIDADVGDVIPEEPLVYNEYQLYSNIETGESNDYNRLTGKDHPELGDSGNYGWGLGTMYDATTDDSGSSIDEAVCPSTSMRPLCDGQLHVTGGNWGSSDGSDMGGMIGTDNTCNNDCPWTVASGYEYDYAIYVRTTMPEYYDSCADVAAANQPDGPYQLSNGATVYCFMDDSGEGWTLALNVHTSDGNVLQYTNLGFWESADELGGAKEHHAAPWRQDYKSTYAFAELDATEMLIVIHDNGVTTQDDSLGWRSWNLMENQPIREYFTGSSANACGEGVADLDYEAYNQMTNGVIDGDVKSLVEEEPMVYDPYDIFTNVENGCSNDFNRMSAKSEARECSSNLGWGLGTLYDYTAGGDDLVCGPDDNNSNRPQLDACFHCTKGQWGSTGGIGGVIGTDNFCPPDKTCSWTTFSDIYYDYAIFVR